MELSGKGVADQICKEYPQFQPLHGIISMKADNLSLEIDNIMGRIVKAVHGFNETSIALTMLTMIGVSVKSRINDPIQREAIIASLGGLYDELKQEFIPDAPQSETKTAETS
jgi:hypothetical protein